jgi:hypothetical protein
MAILGAFSELQVRARGLSAQAAARGVQGEARQAFFVGERALSAVHFHGGLVDGLLELRWHRLVQRLA